MFYLQVHLDHFCGTKLRTSALIICEKWEFKDY